MYAIQWKNPGGKVMHGIPSHEKTTLLERASRYNKQNPFLNCRVVLVRRKKQREINDNNLYVIKWRSLITGAEGHGSLGMTMREAWSIAKSLNREHDGIMHHWVVEQSMWERFKNLWFGRTDKM